MFNCRCHMVPLDENGEPQECYQPQINKKLSGRKVRVKTTDNRWFEGTVDFVSGKNVFLEIYDRDRRGYVFTFVEFISIEEIA